jgi:hypothetical protein
LPTRVEVADSEKYSSLIRNLNLFMIQTPQACTTKLFMSAMVALSRKARVFSTSIHFHPSPLIVGKAEAYQSEALYRTPLYWEPPNHARKH